MCNCFTSHLLSTWLRLQRLHYASGTVRHAPCCSQEVRLLNYALILGRSFSVTAFILHSSSNASLALMPPAIFLGP